jgi:hypothetical protein
MFHVVSASAHCRSTCKYIQAPQGSFGELAQHGQIKKQKTTAKPKAETLSPCVHLFQRLVGNIDRNNASGVVIFDKVSECG